MRSQSSQKRQTTAATFIPRYLDRHTFKQGGEVEHQRVRRQLEEYCGQDTKGMIWIVDALRALLEPNPRASIAGLR